MKKNKEVNKNNSELTLEQVREMLMEIFYKPKVENRDPVPILFQYCITNGWVNRNDLGGKICNDSDCGACISWKEALSNAQKSFITINEEE